MKTSSLGTLIGMETFAEKLGPEYDTQRARRLAKRIGAAVKVEGRIYTTPRLLADSFPELWNEMVLDFGDYRST